MDASNSQYASFVLPDLVCTTALLLVKCPQHTLGVIHAHFWTFVRWADCQQQIQALCLCCSSRHGLHTRTAFNNNHTISLSLWWPFGCRVLYWNGCFSEVSFSPKKAFLHTNVPLLLWLTGMTERKAVARELPDKLLGPASGKGSSTNTCMRVQHKQVYLYASVQSMCQNQWTQGTRATSNKFRITAVLPRHKEGQEKIWGYPLPILQLHLMPARDTTATSDSTHLAINRG